MVSRIPNPFIAGSQWTAGEAIDDWKLHSRIDRKLDALGDVVRTMNSDLASFYGYLPSGYSGAASTNVLWTVGYDTATNYDAAGGRWIVDTAGIYLVSVNLAGSAATAQACTVNRNGSTDPITPWSRDGPAVSNAGPRLGFPVDLDVGDYLAVQPSQAFTTATVGINWWFVQQLTWA